MGWKFTADALLVVGTIRQYLDGIKSHDEKTSQMPSEFQDSIAPDADEFSPERSGTFAKPTPEELAELQAHDARPTDRYSTRRGAAHWTARRAYRGPLKRVSDEEALSMRLSYWVDKVSTKELAAFYRVSLGTVQGIVAGRTHRKAGGPTTELEAKAWKA